MQSTCVEMWWEEWRVKKTILEVPEELWLMRRKTVVDGRMKKLG